MLENLIPPSNGTLTCKIKILKTELDPKDAELLDQYLADVEHWGHSPLSRALKSVGVDLSDTTIAKHRKKECRCY